MTSIPKATRRVSRLRPGDRVAIAGAGPAGLTAAYLLSRDGIDVTVLEADTVVGGISRTVVYKGYRFDVGGHRFFTKIRRVEQLWEELLGDELIDVPRLSRIYYRGKFFDYPLRARNALFGLGVADSVAILLSYLKAQLWPSPEEDNFEQWVSNRFGKRLYNTFFKTYTEKVWGIPCREIRAEWAAQRIQNLSLGQAVLNAASLNKRASKVKSLIHTFRYPRLGPGQMWETCRDRVEQAGARVLTGHRVVATEVDDGRVTALRARTPNGEVRLPCEHVISTMAVRHLVRSLEPALAPEIRESGDGLKYRDFVMVALILDAEGLFPDNWIYVHSPDVRVGRIQNFNNWSRAMIPDEGRTCVGMEYFCFEHDDLWSMADRDLVELASRELGQLRLADPSLVVDACVVRMPKAYPVYDYGYREHLDRVRAALEGIPNLHLVGRNGMHKYNNQDHSMLAAMLTVENMQGARHDTWAVNTDFDYHEHQKLAPARPTDRMAGAMRDLG